MPTTIEIASESKLSSMPMPELVKLHNELSPEKTTKRFSSREAGIKRILKLLAAKQEAGKPAPSSSLPAKDAAQRAPAPKAAKPEGTPASRKPFDLEPRKFIKPHREGTKRAKVIQMLSRANGATFEQVQEECSWDYRTTYEGIKLLHVHCGYGLREAKGRIFLTTKENDAQVKGG